MLDLNVLEICETNNLKQNLFCDDAHGMLEEDIQNMEDDLEDDEISGLMIKCVCGLIIFETSRL
jgi:plasmid rolling circle replication initiator protein Rep